MAGRCVADPALDNRVAAVLAQLAADPQLTGAVGSTSDKVFDALLRRHREYTRKPAAQFKKQIQNAIERVKAKQAAAAARATGAPSSASFSANSSNGTQNSSSSSSAAATATNDSQSNAGGVQQGEGGKEGDEQEDASLDNDEGMGDDGEGVGSDSEVDVDLATAKMDGEEDDDEEGSQQEGGEEEGGAAATAATTAESAAHPKIIEVQAANMNSSLYQHRQQQPKQPAAALQQQQQAAPATASRKRRKPGANEMLTATLRHSAASAQSSAAASAGIISSSSASGGGGKEVRPPPRKMARPGSGLGAPASAGGALAAAAATAAGGSSLDGYSGPVPSAAGYQPFELPPYVRPAERYAHMGGIGSILPDIRETIEYPLTHPELYSHLGVAPPTGILLHGPPGCGKSLLARAIAGELGVYFRSVAGPEVVGGVSGESESRLRAVFDDALAHAPALIFIDEVDAIAPKRDSSQRGMERRIVSTLLSCLDAVAAANAGTAAAAEAAPSVSSSETGEASNASSAEATPAVADAAATDAISGAASSSSSASSSSASVIATPSTLKPVMVLAATSRPDGLDPGLRRAGRLDREIALPIPDEDAREQILRVLTSRMRIAEGGQVSIGGVAGASSSSSSSSAAAAADSNSSVAAGGDDAMQVDTDAPPSSSSSSSSLPLPLASGFDYRSIARATPGYVGSDLAALTKEAAVCAVNRAFSQLFGVSSGRPSDSATSSSSSGRSGSGTGKERLDLQAWSAAGALLRTAAPLTSAQLTASGLAVTYDDFTRAIPKVQPSATREGFATIPNVSWADVGALSDVRAELEMAIVQPLRRPELFAALGLRAPAGVLLFGPPGCGKTLLAKAIANETSANFISIKGPELLDKYVGESERAVRQVFARARSSAPCIVFFDELDALAPRRGGSGGGSSGGNNVTERVVNQLLTELDGLDVRRDVFIVAATNRPDIIDPAMLRPGRLDKLLYVPLPTPDERAAVLKKQTRHTPLAPDVDLSALALDHRCDRFSGADLAGLVREASVAALKEYLLSSRGFVSGDDAVSSSSSSSSSSSTAAAPTPSICVHQRHFVAALSKSFPSVSPADERLYNSMQAKLRNSRSHLNREATAGAAGAAGAAGEAPVSGAGSTTAGVGANAAEQPAPGHHQ